MYLIGGCEGLMGSSSFYCCYEVVHLDDESFLWLKEYAVTDELLLSDGSVGYK